MGEKPLDERVAELEIAINLRANLDAQKVTDAEGVAAEVRTSIQEIADVVVKQASLIGSIEARLDDIEAALLAAGISNEEAVDALDALEATE